jgi:hypothetical protein
MAKIKQNKTDANNPPLADYASSSTIFYEPLFIMLIVS